MDMPESKSKKLAIVVLGALVVILVIAGIALMMRGGGDTPVRIILPAPGDLAGGNGPAGTESPQTTQAELDLQVYVSGAVLRPGVYTLKSGDRLIDAVEAAAARPLKPTWNRSTWPSGSKMRLNTRSQESASLLIPSQTPSRPRRLLKTHSATRSSPLKD